MSIDDNVIVKLSLESFPREFAPQRSLSERLAETERRPETTQARSEGFERTSKRGFLDEQRVATSAAHALAPEARLQRTVALGPKAWRTGPAEGKALPGETHRTYGLSDQHLGAGIIKTLKESDYPVEWRGEQFSQWKQFQIISVLADLTEAHAERVKEWEKYCDEQFKATGVRPTFGPEDKVPYQLELVLLGDIFDVLCTDYDAPDLPLPDGRDAGGAIKNTIANVKVVLENIRRGHPMYFQALAHFVHLGHKLTFIPGNHDNALAEEPLREAMMQMIGAELTTIVKSERGNGAWSHLEEKAKVAAGLERFSIESMARRGNYLLFHSNRADSTNVTRLPDEPWLRKRESEHQELPRAFADNGVVYGANPLLNLAPKLAGIDDHWSFLVDAFREHKLPTLRTVAAFLTGIMHDASPVLPEVDAKERELDAIEMVHRYPKMVADIRRYQPELSLKEIEDGMVAITKAGATPITSMFRKDQGFLSRWWSVVRRSLGKPGYDGTNLRIALAAQKSWGIEGMIVGHSHVATDHTIEVISRLRQPLTRLLNWLGFAPAPTKQVVRIINAHTAMDKSEAANRGKGWGLARAIWGDQSIGLPLVKFGKDADGNRWNSATLLRIENAQIKDGDIAQVVQHHQDIDD